MTNQNNEPRSRDNRPIPGINVRELIEERNWAALAGLGLVVVGLLSLFGDLLDLDFNLWSAGLLAIGGWLAFDGWQRYERAGRRWSDQSRNRLVGGSLIAGVGALSIMELGGWEWFLLVIAGALLYNAYQHYERAGNVWTEQSRSRLIGGIAVALIGLFGLINMWATWPLILIGVGVAMLFRRSRR